MRAEIGCVVVLMGAKGIAVGAVAAGERNEHVGLSVAAVALPQKGGIMTNTLVR